MSSTHKPITGGCLCGGLRYEATSAPTLSGYCCCADCRKASGSGFIPFMGFKSEAVRIMGTPRQHVGRSARGSDAVRNFCPSCGGLVFGGEAGKDSSLTIYAGSLDDASLFQPTIAIFTRGLPEWVVLPAGVKMFATVPE